MKILWLSVLVGVCGCASIPKGVEPVAAVDIERYMGRWYEIARQDHWFERGLVDVSAQYRLKQDGGVEVVNRGYSTEKQAWKDVTGRAKVVGGSEGGRLKVSFFRPFYGGYNILKLDDAYQTALVCGNSRKYLWLLSRDANPPASIVATYLEAAAEMGFETNKLIFVTHER